MASRYYRDRLQSVLTTARDDSLASASQEWVIYSSWIDGLSAGLRSEGKNLASQIDGQTGSAMLAKFALIAEKLDVESADLQKGSAALDTAHTGTIHAIQARNGDLLSGPMNQMPGKPEGPTPGAPATPEQQVALANYNSQVAQYEANEQAAEDKARLALQFMDQQYAEATLVMKEIHGEPDPETPDRTPSAPAGPGSPSMPATPISGPGPTPVSSPSGGGGGTGGVKPSGQGGVVINTDPDCGITGAQPTVTQHPPVITTTPPTHHDPTGPTVPTGPTGPTGPTTNVQGQTDAGSTYPGSTGGSASGPASGPAPSVGGGAVTGVGAGGAMAGVSLGAGMGKGGIPTSSSALKAGSVRGIGAGGRAGASGSLTRGTTSATSSTRAGTSAAPTRSAGTRAAGGGSTGAGARTGAAGSSSAKGSGKSAGKGSSKGSSKGRGLFRRGSSNGSTAGGRSGNKKTDERGPEVDSLVYDQDWLGEDTAAPGVLD